MRRGTVKIRLVLSILVLAGLFSLSRAARPYVPHTAGSLVELWRWNPFPELEGAGIRHIIESGNGTVWVGCNKGVLEYDGYGWITHGEKEGLPAGPVEQVMQAADGSIYATMATGIFRYDGQRWSPFFVLKNTRTFDFHRIKELPDGSIFVCSNWGFLHFLTGRQLNFYSSALKIKQLEGSLPGANMIALPADALSENADFDDTSDVLPVENGEVWFAITTRQEFGKLLKFKPAGAGATAFPAFEIMGEKDDLNPGEDQRLLQAADGRIWVINSTSNKGLNIFDGEQWESISISKLFGGDEYMTDIVQSPNGTIWMSSIARIFSYNPQGEWEMYKAPNYPVPANRVILQTSQNDQLWVAGYKSKVLRVDCSSEKWMTLKNLSFQFEVTGNEQWFLERDNSVVRRIGDEWVAFGEEDGLMDAPIRVIRTSRGQTWAAGSHNGRAATAVLEGNRWKLHIHPRLSWGIDYRAVFEARDGTIWFGGAVDAQTRDGFRSGLVQLPDPLAAKPEWIYHFYGENGLTQANAYGIGQSPDGRIWIGGSRLLYFDGKNWNALPDEPLRQFVNYVHSTDELLLVGSRYYGLFVYDGKTWKNYGNAEGLSGNTVISIDALSDSIFIVATENDICKFDGTSWTQNVFPEALNLDFEGGTIRHTDQYLWVNHVPRSWKRRAFQPGHNSQERYDFFTTRYQPSRMPPETKPDFYREAVPSDGNGLISWQGMDFFANNATDELMFSYRLDAGLWSPYSRKNQYSFNGLYSGDHVFEIRARDLDFNVDPTPARITFEVLLPIWKQGWFISLILAFLTIFGVYEYRVLRKKRQLEIVNVSLQEANQSLQEKGRQIERQNREILVQQQRILEQSEILEIRNTDLQERNEETSQQRDKLEEMLLQVQNLSKAKLVFFTNISHELRTPLTLILGPVSHLQNEDAELSATERNQLYGIIQRNGSRLLKLINQLLEIRRIEQTVLEVNLSDVSLQDFIGDIVGMFADLASRRGIQLQFRDEHKLSLVAIDTDKVEKIIVNLLSNAFRHTPDREGSVTVGLREVTSFEAELNTSYDRYLEISVSDTGTGISPEQIDMIFDQYYTSESTVSDQTGMGIGLSYVKDLVYLMQGEIRVSSQLQQGSVFRVYLPYVAAQTSVMKGKKIPKPRLKVSEKEASFLLANYGVEAEQAVPALPVPAADLPLVLVVEDNPDMLNFLENLLRGNYAVVTAVNGEEGLEMARNLSLDLIVSDVMMAKMDGLTFCENIKSNLLTSHIPVILLTARILDANKMSGYLKGADDYITKPFNPEMLLVRIANLLQQRNQLREVLSREFLLRPKSETLRSPDEEFMERLVQLMNDNVSEAEFNVNAMCQAMHLSHMHFIRKVKQLTGKKPIALLKSFRMKKAKDLLAQRSSTIAEVAYMVGFDLPNSFSRAFKKEFDLTPTEYLNSLPAGDVAEVLTDKL